MPQIPDEGLGPTRIRKILGDGGLALAAGLPTLVWYMLFRFVHASLLAAATAAVAIGLASMITIVVFGGLLHWRWRPHLRLVAVSFGLLVVSVGLAVATGDAKDYFLPGIVVDSVYTLVLVASVCMRRPLLGLVISTVLRRWRIPLVGVEREYRILTLMWAGVFALEASVLALLYSLGDLDLLVVVRLVMRGPIHGIALLVTVTVLTRAGLRRRQGGG